MLKSTHRATSHQAGYEGFRAAVFRSTTDCDSCAVTHSGVAVLSCTFFIFSFMCPLHPPHPLTPFLRLPLTALTQKNCGVTSSLREKRTWSYLLKKEHLTSCRNTLSPFQAEKSLQIPNSEWCILTRLALYFYVAVNNPLPKHIICSIIPALITKYLGDPGQVYGFQMYSGSSEYECLSLQGFVTINTTVTYWVFRQWAALVSTK